MPLNHIQESAINQYMKDVISDLSQLEDKPKALRAFQLLLKEETLSLDEGAALSGWFIDKDKKDSLLGSVAVVQSIMMHHAPQGEGALNLVRGDDLSGDNFPKVSAREVKDYIAGVINGHINELKDQRIEAAPIPEFSREEKKKVIQEEANRSLQDIETYKSGAKKIFKSAVALFIVQGLIKGGAETVALSSDDKEIIERSTQIIGSIEGGDWKEKLLEYSIKKGNKDLTRALLEVLVDAGVNLEVKDRHGDTLLNRAVRDNNIDIAKILADAGAKLEGGADLLRRAVLDNNIDMVKVLAAAGAVLEGGAESLTRAVLDNNIDIVKVLAAAGVNLEDKDNMGHGYLMRAVRDNNIDMAKALIDAGANLEVRDGSYNSLLTRAVINGNLGMVKVLIDAGADFSKLYNFEIVNIVKEHGKDSLQLLKDVGADTDFGKLDRGEILAIVADHGKDSLQLLKDVGADLSELRSYDIVNIIKAQGKDSIQLLKDVGADLSELRSYDIVDIIKEHGKDSIQLLKDVGADLSELRSYDIVDIIKEHGKDSLQLLKDAGADVNFADQSFIKNDKILENIEEAEKSQEDKGSKYKAVLPDSFVDDLLKDERFIEGMNRVESNIEGVLGEGSARPKNQEGSAINVESFADYDSDLISPMAELTGAIQGSRVQERLTQIDGGSKDMVQYNPENKITKEISAVDQLALAKVVTNLAQSVALKPKAPKGVAGNKKPSSRGR